jgi:hypothetical protein
MSFLQELLAFFTKDFTGKTWTREQMHPYFGKMLYFGSEDASKSYWEAELTPEGEGKVGITFEGTPDGPTDGEDAFCRKALADLDALFEKCRAAFSVDFPTWTESTMPANWRDSFELDGLSLPRHGDPSNAWEVCYFVDLANHWFTAVFENGAVTDVRIDG